MIAREGRTILFGLMILAFASGIAGYAIDSIWLIRLYLVLGFVFLFALNFFRDPHREVPDDAMSVVSPADGKVVRIQTVNDPDVGENATLVSIFLNIFNVHVNRVPVSGTVHRVQYQAGKFLAAFNHAASDENEQTSIVLDHSSGKIRVKQIAGLIARRIHCYAREGVWMNKGDRLGYIMFGSRTDIILPASVSIEVQEGQKVVGNKTILGKIE